MSKQRQFVGLIILDGFGLSLIEEGNAIRMAKTPTFDELIGNYPCTTVEAAGMAVGLPWGEPGNSEVGHINLGAGQVIYQPYPRINLAIDDKSFFKNPKLLDAVEHAKKNKSNIHLVGLMSNGGVHAHVDHLLVLLDFCKQQKMKKNVFIHPITDGRDTPPQVALTFFETLEKHMKKTGVGQIASVLGRFYAMDRNTNWDRIEKAYRAMIGQSELKSRDHREVVIDGYKRGLDDESMECATIVDRKDNPIGPVQANDVVIFFNFRPDRARQLTQAFVLKNFKDFKREEQLPLKFLTMMQYEEGLPVDLIFEPQYINKPMGKIISAAGMTQLRIAETEKYAHVTYFFNGGSEDVLKGEDRVLIPSPDVKTYDMKPEMSAVEVTDEAMKRIATQKYGFMALNYANPDMVGHTGKLKAGIRAIETVDQCLGRTLEAIRKINGIAIITADHGNAEEMISPVTGKTSKEHSSNPVSVVIMDPARKVTKSEGEILAIRNEITPVGILADVAPTILELLKLDPSEEMTGRSLLGDCR